MAKDKLTEYDSNAANNTVVGDVNLAENSALPSDMNNAVREVMSHLKEFAEGTNGINVLSLADDDASASIKFQAPSAVTTTVTFTLPDGDGESGQTLVTNGSGTLAWHAPYGNRNLIINGAASVNQRGDSTGVTASQYGGPDRFKLGIATAGTFDISQSSTAPNGFANSYKLDCTTADASLAAGDLVAAQTRIEGQDLQRLKKGTSDAESVTLSFFVRSNKTGTYVVELLDNHNNRQVTKTYTISSADTFEYKSITFPADTSGAFNDNNSNALSILWWLAAGTNWTSGTATGSWAASTAANRAVGLNVNIADSTSNEWLITGVQLEVGEQATPFEHRSFGDELARCQRYFYKVTNASPGGAATRFGQGHALNSTTAKAVVPTPVTLRTVPTVTSAGTLNVSDASSGTTVTSLSLEAVTSSAETVCLSATVASGLTAFRPMFLEGQSGADEAISIDAEL